MCWDEIPSTHTVGGNMKSYKYERYTLRLTKEIADYLNVISQRRGIAPTALIKSIIGEYKEANRIGNEQQRD